MINVGCYIVEKSPLRLGWNQVNTAYIIGFKGTKNEYYNIVWKYKDGSTHTVHYKVNFIKDYFECVLCKCFNEDLEKLVE